MNGSSTSGIRQVSEDVLALLDLQWRMIQLDGREVTRRAIAAGLLAGAAACLGIAALTIFGLSVGWLVHEYGELAVGWALLVVGIVFVALAGIVALIAIASVRRASAAIGESTDEISENLRSVRAAIFDPQAPRGGFDAPGENGANHSPADAAGRR